MTAPRVAAHMQVDAIRRLCEAQGGFATVLAKGDRIAGDILIIYPESRGNPCILRRSVRWEGPPSWAETESQAFENERELEDFLSLKRKIDPDIWLIELDVPDRERFTALLHEFI